MTDLTLSTQDYRRFDTEAEVVAYISAQMNSIERFTIFDTISLKTEYDLLMFVLGFVSMKVGVFEPSYISFDLYDIYPSFTCTSEYFSLEWTSKFWFYDQGQQRTQWLVKLTIPGDNTP